MKIGIPKEIIDNENRVAMTIEAAKVLREAGHEVLIEASAGVGAGMSDEDYKSAGASVIASAKELYDRADIIVKVKQPEEPEFGLFREGQGLFSYIHSETRRGLTDTLLNKRMTAVAFEDVRKDDGMLPLLFPMSEIAGKMAVFLGAQYLQTINGGGGVALVRLTGIKPPKVMILGGGNAGRSAAISAAALGAEVIILEINPDKIRSLSREMPPNVVVMLSNSVNARECLKGTDLLINAAVWPLNTGTHLVTRDMLALMNQGGVIVDITADNAGAVETIMKKTHTNPTYVVDGIVHYCVSNIPGIVPRASVPALVNAFLPYLLEIASKGFRKALKENKELLRGLSFIDGKLTNRLTAKIQGREYVPPEEAI